MLYWAETGSLAFGRMEPFATDIKMRFKQEVGLVEFDALEWNTLSSFPNRLQREFGEFHLVVLVVGYLGEQGKAIRDTAEMQHTLNELGFPTLVAAE